MKKIGLPSPLSGILSLLCVFAASAKEKGESHTVGRWQYGCMADHKSPYGDVLNSANCWMMICEPSHSDACLYILEIRKGGIRLIPIDVEEACKPAPSEAAVDGIRIDGLSGDQQVRSITAGKSITRQVQGRGWRYCENKDIEWSLAGAKKTWELLKTLEARGKYLE